MTTYLLQQNNICLNHLHLKQKNDMTFDKRHTAIRGHPKHGFSLLLWKQQKQRQIGWLNRFMSSGDGMYMDLN